MTFTSTPFSDAVFIPNAIGLLDTTVATFDLINFFFVASMMLSILLPLPEIKMPKLYSILQIS